MWPCLLWKSLAEWSPLYTWWVTKFITLYPRELPFFVASNVDTKWFISKLSMTIISWKYPGQKRIFPSPSVMNHHRVKMDPLDMITVVSFFAVDCCCVFMLRCQCVNRYVWIDKSLTQLLSKYDIKFFCVIKFFWAYCHSPTNYLSLTTISLTFLPIWRLRWRVYLSLYLQIDDRLRLIKS